MLKLRIKRFQPMRCLRSYRRISREFRSCCRCPNDIVPGDAYYGEVWVMPGAQVPFWVYFEHETCPDKTYEELAEKDRCEDCCDQRETQMRAA